LYTGNKNYSSYTRELTNTDIGLLDINMNIICNHDQIITRKIRINTILLHVKICKIYAIIKSDENSYMMILFPVHIKKYVYLII
jgi:hypothetical protein